MAVTGKAARAARKVEDVLKGIEAAERKKGLLGIRAEQGEPDPVRSSAITAALNSAPPGGGLLTLPGGGQQSLLSPHVAATKRDPQAAASPTRMNLGFSFGSSPPAQRPSPPTDRWEPVRNGLDDFFFGGAAGEAATRRRQRERSERLIAVRDQAFGEAMAGGSFDPNAFARVVAGSGLSLDQDDINALEGITDSQDVRWARTREERRGVQAGALAPLLGMTDEERGSAAPGSLAWLAQQGMPYEGPLDTGSLGAVVGGGMGANAFLDNARGDRALAENIRSQQANESYRDRELGWRQQTDDRNFSYQQGRDQADDAYRDEELDFRRDALTVPNSTGDVVAPILAKVATQGEGSLNEGERAIFDNWKRQQQTPFGTAPGLPGLPGLPGGPSSGPQGAGSSPQNPARPQTEADFARLPAGSYFVDPDSGELLQK
jgi:hypothetical protein